MFSINYRDPRPVYEQIVDRLRGMIISGIISPDEKLPSVRDLASQLAINPNTIQRAYRELEQSGYIYSVPGKGNFAGRGMEVDRKRKAQLLKTLTDTVRELKYLGLSDDELARYLQGSDEGEGPDI